MAKRIRKKSGKTSESTQLSLPLGEDTPAKDQGETTEPAEATATPPQPKAIDKAATSKPSKGAPRSRAVDRSIAEAMARGQRDISVAEFFAKNRHLLGFDNKRKAVLTSVKEAVDNSLDACEEARILPEIDVRITQLDENRFRLYVADNGPGIVKDQIPSIFGRLLYGSKFHRLKMSRGQQGIGISAAGMYGLLTTGRPVHIWSRTGASSKGHHYQLAIDTKKNRPEIIKEEPADVDFEHGTVVQIDMEGTYTKGRQSIDEYLEQTAIANPHARITYHMPTGERCVFDRAVDELPPETKEIRPHPHGIELGMLLRMLKDTSQMKLGGFLSKEFSRLGGAAAAKIATKVGLTANTWVKTISTQQGEALYRAMQATKVLAPPTDCLAPIGPKQILAGLLKEVKAEFYTASTRSPAVYRGNPFQIEVGLAYGGDLPGEDVARVIRFANRVPLLYQQSHCCVFKSVLDTNWRGYSLSQSRSALPSGPLVIMVHMASVWVPFTSESKEAIADYDEIRKEIKLALQECGRKLNTYLGRRARRRREGQRRGVFQRYIGEVVEAVHAIQSIDKQRLYDDLVAVANRITARADVQFDEDGNLVEPTTPAVEMSAEDTVIVDRQQAEPVPEDLFKSGASANGKKRTASRRSRKRAS